MRHEWSRLDIHSIAVLSVEDIVRRMIGLLSERSAFIGHQAAPAALGAWSPMVMPLVVVFLL